MFLTKKRRALRGCQAVQARRAGPDAQQSQEGQGVRAGPGRLHVRALQAGQALRGVRVVPTKIINISMKILCFCMKYSPVLRDVRVGLPGIADTGRLQQDKGHL